MKSLIFVLNLFITWMTLFILLQLVRVSDGKQLLNAWSQRYGNSQFIYTEDELSDFPSNVVAAVDEADEINDDTDDDNNSNDDYTTKVGGEEIKNSNNNSNQRNTRPTKNKDAAELQFMITNKMRNTLIQELGYLSSEVDDMEPQVSILILSMLPSSSHNYSLPDPLPPPPPLPLPLPMSPTPIPSPVLATFPPIPTPVPSPAPSQIAAVVIERSLRRPRKGMPASWRRSSVNNSTGANLWKENLLNFAKGAIDFTNNQVRPILPVLIVSSLLYFQRDSILFIANSLWRSVNSNNFHFFKGKKDRLDDGEEDREIIGKSRSRKPFASSSTQLPPRWNKNSSTNKGFFWGKKDNTGNRRVSEEPEIIRKEDAPTAEIKQPAKDKIDIKSYDLVVTQSWWDQNPLSSSDDNFST